MEQMRNEWGVKLLLDQLSLTSSDAETVRALIAELWPPTVCLMIVTYERGRWDRGNVAGRRQLATFVEIIPDEQSVETAHQHIRDLERTQRKYVSTRLRRSVAIMNSGVLEGRGIVHRTITKDLPAFKQLLVSIDLCGK